MITLNNKLTVETVDSNYSPSLFNTFEQDLIAIIFDFLGKELVSRYAELPPYWKERVIKPWVLPPGCLRDNLLAEYDNFHGLAGEIGVVSEGKPKEINGLTPSYLSYSEESNQMELYLKNTFLGSYFFDKEDYFRIFKEDQDNLTIYQGQKNSTVTISKIIDCDFIQSIWQLDKSETASEIKHYTYWTYQQQSFLAGINVEKTVENSLLTTKECHNYKFNKINLETSNITHFNLQLPSGNEWKDCYLSVNGIFLTIIWETTPDQEFLLQTYSLDGNNLLYTNRYKEKPEIYNYKDQLIVNLVNEGIFILDLNTGKPTKTITEETKIYSWEKIVIADHRLVARPMDSSTLYIWDLSGDNKPIIIHTRAASHSDIVLCEDTLILGPFFDKESKCYLLECWSTTGKYLGRKIVEKLQKEPNQFFKQSAFFNTTTKTMYLTNSEKQILNWSLPFSTHS